MSHTKRMKRKDPNIYPPGLNYRKVQGIIKYYDSRKNEDLIGDIVLPTPDNLPVWMEVPQRLVPQVRKLIARYKKSA